MRARRIARAIVAASTLIGGGALVASCNEIVGIDGTFHDAVATMCACGQVAAQFYGDVAKCTKTYNAFLTAAKPAVVRAWLDTYASLNCDLCVDDYADTKLACIHSQPFCRADGESCTDGAQCCGYPTASSCIHSGDDLVGKCTAGCVAEGDLCETDDQCCGYHGANPTLGYDPPYCNQNTHTCFREKADCARSFTSCANRACCEGDLQHQCTGSGITQVCVELCTPGHAHNCPGCCAVIFSVDGKEQYAVCADSQPQQCVNYCTDEGSPCPDGRLCQRSCDPVPGLVASCHLECK